MGLDIRWPIGLMFTLLGVLLTGYGVIYPAGSLALDININLRWGLVLLVFGIFMVVMAWRGSKKSGPPQK
jgi:hypothetical protein